MPSTAIRSLQYEPAARALDIEFISGRRYRYSGVPEETARAFRSAFSKGRFFNARIRDRFACVELTAEPEEWGVEWVDRRLPDTTSSAPRKEKGA
ncbi:KTSC domain-containing protein [Croceibacterium sp. LX-88]|jgi:lysyl-tRNA synthetase class 2|uniref:KTSC domain-containing protein n=2 Tax=Croceibacterium selenioxidans TaxID=2838833 RepID=A0ABS5W4Z3_9SPHN|nr:KTSC domain-containing protein [Croceibacterium selenioxidans]MBT2134822.1 KTSC domain-containing protein [Croceibacterium selenioxidans]